jgi:triphosphoribosyl-dephospho-CoA synthetase
MADGSDRYRSIKPYIVTDTMPTDNWQGSVLLDRQHYLHDRYGASAACLYLIRPDWFVGFRGSLSHAEELENYLQQVLIA